jgi:hypothetical protein
MEFISNRFALLDFDSDSESKDVSNTPPYSPSPCPINDIEQIVEFNNKLECNKKEDNRFNTLINTKRTFAFSKQTYYKSMNIENNSLTSSRKRPQFIDLNIRGSKNSLRNKFLNTASNTDFPIFISSTPKEFNTNWKETFATKVSKITDIKSKKEDEEDKEDKNRETNLIISPLRFRRTLEEILTESDVHMELPLDDYYPVDEECGADNNDY